MYVYDTYIHIHAYVCIESKYKAIAWSLCRIKYRACALKSIELVSYKV
jgi:hypothetical protein